MMNWSLNDPAGTAPDAEVVVNVPSKAALLAAVERRLAAGEGFSVATLNLDHVVKLRHDAAFRDAYARHSDVVADGNPIVWLSRLAGRPVDLVPGSELVEPVAEVAARLGVPVALFGATDASLKGAAETLVGRNPGLDIVARIAPPMGFDPTGTDADAAVEEMAGSGARLCFLALGAPKQEIFAARAQERLPHVGFISVGAGLDFLSGNQRRAPALVRVVAAEWVWRLASDPGRLARRYGACVAILPGLTRTALRARGNRASDRSAA